MGKRIIATGATGPAFDDNAPRMVNTGATLYIDGDAYPYTVVAMATPSKVGIRRCRPLHVSDDRYVYAETYDAIEWYTRRKSGRWVRKGCRDKGRGGSLRFGRREFYLAREF